MASRSKARAFLEVGWKNRRAKMAARMRETEVSHSKKQHHQCAREQEKSILAIGLLIKSARSDGSLLQKAKDLGYVSDVALRYIETMAKLQTKPAPIRKTGRYADERLAAAEVVCQLCEHFIDEFYPEDFFGETDIPERVEDANPPSLRRAVKQWRLALDADAATIESNDTTTSSR